MTAAIELITHTNEAIAATRRDWSGVFTGGLDLSAAAAVQFGMWANNPLQGDFVCFAPRGFITVPGVGTLRGWVREYTVDFKGWALSATDDEPGRMAAACYLGACVVLGAQAAFQDAATPTDLYQEGHGFRVAELNTFDGHELGFGRQGMISGSLVYRVQGPEGA